MIGDQNATYKLKMATKLYEVVPHQIMRQLISWVMNSVPACTNVLELKISWSYLSRLLGECIAQLGSGQNKRMVRNNVKSLNRAGQTLSWNLQNGNPPLTQGSNEIGLPTYLNHLLSIWLKPTHREPLILQVLRFHTVPTLVRKCIVPIIWTMLL